MNHNPFRCIVPILKCFNNSGKQNKISNQINKNPNKYKFSLSFQHFLNRQTVFLAAYAYGFEERRFNGYRLLVYDFGGGTFDVSIIEVCDKRFEVRAIDGDIQLGGRDLDILLRDYCAAEIKKGWEFDCLGTQLNASKLLEKCEQVKILLSQNDETRSVAARKKTEWSENISGFSSEEDRDYELGFESESF